MNHQTTTHYGLTITAEDKRNYYKAMQTNNDFKIGQVVELKDNNTLSAQLGSLAIVVRGKHYDKTVDGILITVIWIEHTGQANGGYSPNQFQELPEHESKEIMRQLRKGTERGKQVIESWRKEQKEIASSK